MTDNQPPQLAPVRVVIPFGVVLFFGGIGALSFFDMGLVGGAITAVLVLAGLAMIVQSIIRLSRGEGWGPPRT